MKRQELLMALNELLQPGQFKDYCPNGLQVEGREEVRKIVCGVTASQALLDAAVARGADTVLVHHGYFWKGEDMRVIGIRKRRLATLLNHDINLIGYHLPLDAHPVVGNNAQLAKLFGWTVSGYFGEYNLGVLGEPAQPLTQGALVQQIEAVLGRSVTHIGDVNREVRKVAWCSGGADDWFADAIDAGADFFLTGEIAEPAVHLAREAGVAFVAAGHHATERYGVKALGEWLHSEYGLECEFVDIDNPA